MNLPQILGLKLSLELEPELVDVSLLLRSCGNVVNVYQQAGATFSVSIQAWICLALPKTPAHELTSNELIPVACNLLESIKAAQGLKHMPLLNLGAFGTVQVDLLL
jgi:hypothetical protein